MRNGNENKVVAMPKRQESPLGIKAAQVLGAAQRPADVFGDLAADSSAARETITKDSGRRLSYISVEQIEFSPYQTREVGDEEELEGLAKSIEQKGVLQPIILRPNSGEDAQYQLIAGERRLRAARRAGLETIPAIVEEFSDREAVELSIIENAQRENLNPIEEALGYHCLISDFNLNQTEVARVIGKNRATISNSLRLLQLDQSVIDMLKEGELSAGHGRALLPLEDHSLQRRFAARVVHQSLSVRLLEQLVARFFSEEEEEELSEEDEKALASLARAQKRVSDLLELEQVSLNFDAQGRKRLNLTFETEASWRRFMSKIR